MTRLKKASAAKNFIDVNMLNFNHDFLSEAELDTKILKHPIEVVYAPVLLLFMQGICGLKWIHLVAQL